MQVNQTWVVKLVGCDAVAVASEEYQAAARWFQWSFKQGRNTCTSTKVRVFLAGALKAWGCCAKQLALLNFTAAEDASDLPTLTLKVAALC